MAGRPVPNACSNDGRDMIRQLRGEGWTWGQTASSHFRLEHPDAPRPVVVPHRLYGPRVRGVLRTCRKLVGAGRADPA